MPLALFNKNIFGQFIFVKKFIIRLFGSIVYFRFNWRYKNDIKGFELLKELPDRNVLFVSNHQTYFADVSYFFVCFHAAFHARYNNIKFPGFLFPKRHNIYYIAAEETMKSGFLPKLLALSGAVTVQRAWRSNGENVRRKVDRKGNENIDKALNDGWLVTFPQGTTSPYAKGRVGTAILMKQHKPVVVPIVIDGFRRSFDKKGIKKKKTKSTLKVTMKQPLDVDYSKTVEEILEQVMDAIEQSPKFNKIDQLIEKEPD